jgi:hypothetical protein
VSYENICGHVSSESVGRWLPVLNNVTVIWIDVACMISLFEVTAEKLSQGAFWHADCKAESV